MRFIYDAPAVIYEQHLIVGDSHFGMEIKLSKKGIYDYNFSLRLADRLKEICERHNIKNIIFLGDVKEEIGVLDEYTIKAFERINNYNIKIIKGNHDGGIEELGLPVYDELIIGKVGLIHGHAWPSEKIMKCEKILAGHQHPQLEQYDRFGKKHSEPVWVFVPPNKNEISKKYQRFNENIELILIPAFNPLVGYPINKSVKKLGPLLNNNLFKLKDALLFRLDGTPLGVLKDK